MEKKTRVNKYKNLREEMKEEVAIDRHVALEEEIADDDFLAFLPRDEKSQLDDTLIEPLSYETLEENNVEVRQALNEAKINVGKEQYNTRLDILNKIKQDESEYVPAHEYQATDFSRGHVVKEEPVKKMSLLEKLAAMSPEEDAEELKKFEEDITVADLMGSKKKKRNVIESKESTEGKVKKTRKTEKPDLDINDDCEEESKLVTVLNYVVLAFVVVLVILAFFVMKQLLF